MPKLERLSALVAENEDLDVLLMGNEDENPVYYVVRLSGFGWLGECVEYGDRFYDDPNEVVEVMEDEGCTAEEIAKVLGTYRPCIWATWEHYGWEGV